MDEAKRAGDQARVREIDESMRERQQRFHEMGFSRTDVSSLIDPVRDQLQKVADAAGVDLIVSKWQLEYQREGTTLVNVTDVMVELFEPNDRARTWARQVQESEPLSAEEARRGH